LPGETIAAMGAMPATLGSGRSALSIADHSETVVPEPGETVVPEPGEIGVSEPGEIGVSEPGDVAGAPAAWPSHNPRCKCRPRV
jgi:hypothetical protein